MSRKNQKNNEHDTAISLRKKKVVNFFIRFYNLLILIIVLLIFGLGYFFLLQPKYKQISYEFDTIRNSYQAEYLQRHKKFKDLISLKEAYDSLRKSDIEKIELLLPDADGIEDILSQLEFIALRNGLFINTIQIDEKAEKIDTTNVKKNVRNTPDKTQAGSVLSDDLAEQIGIINIQIEIAGADYLSLKRLLRVLQGNLRLYNIVYLS